MKGAYIITGTSRGIGKAVAEHLLENGNCVFGVSRTPSPLSGTAGFYDFTGSVTDPELIESVFKKVKDTLSRGDFAILCLLSNAAVLEPLKPLEQCSAAEIRQQLEINLTAPITISARFAAFFRDMNLRRKIVHMTSGAAKMPLADASLYCISKAGISMLCECLATEQKDLKSGVEVAAISPGMVETEMQEIARSRDLKEFRSGEMFRSAKERGVVQELDAVVQKIVSILESRTEPGQTISVQEWTKV